MPAIYISDRGDDRMMVCRSRRQFTHWRGLRSFRAVGISAGILDRAHGRIQKELAESQKGEASGP
jgi:hypothetical protein